ncbi:hypothetical protein PFISCL1PPCAC_27706, partial [Pristionchus fissidentatus]
LWGKQLTMAASPKTEISSLGRAFHISQFGENMHPLKAIIVATARGSDFRTFTNKSSAKPLMAAATELSLELHRPEISEWTFSRSARLFC